MKRAIVGVRDGIAARMPASLKRSFGPAANYLRMLFGDHLIVRLLFTNRHQLAPGVWRSAQPLPHQIRQMQRQGVRTIVNLRGVTKTATHVIEKDACARAGITMIDLPLKSRGAPSREMLRAIADLFDTAQRPMVLHCKSGADRAGLASALYLHLKQGTEMDAARKQLSLRYGHFRQADTGILDDFLERYIADNAKQPMPFLEWVDTVYDPDELEGSFKAKGWATRIVRQVLRRE